MPVRSPRRGRHAARRRTPRLLVLPGAVLVVAGAAGARWATASPAPAASRPIHVSPVAASVVLAPLDHGADAERASRSRRADLAPPPPPPVAAPTFVRPVDGPETSPFGMRWGRLHAGLDFGVPVGTPVKAVTDAVVLSVAWDPRGYGNYITLQLPDGTLVIYGHLSQVLIPAGPVAAGQVVALSGDTGHSTGPHLHFELRGPTGPFDPRPWLEARGIVV